MPASKADTIPVRPGKRVKARGSLSVVLVPAALLVVILYGIAESWSVRQEEIEIPLRGLPLAAQGLKLIQVSDLHSRPGLWESREVARLLSGMSASLLVITGDFKQAGGSPDLAVEGGSVVVDAVKGRMPVYAVTGNHDSAVIMERLSQRGISVLENRSYQVLPGLWFAGWDPYKKRHPSLEEVFRPVPPGDCIIVLSHSPDVVFEKGVGRAGLILAGHTHGGQIRLPGLRPFTTLTRLGTRFASGLFPWGDGFLYINRGIGTTMVPLRMYAAPEITRVTLRTAPASLENSLN